MILICCASALLCQGLVRKMDMALVQGKMIRYVHIPDEVDAISNLQRHVSLHHRLAFITIQICYCQFLTVIFVFCSALWSSLAFHR